MEVARRPWRWVGTKEEDEGDRVGLLPGGGSRRGVAGQGGGGRPWRRCMVRARRREGEGRREEERDRARGSPGGAARGNGRER